MSTAASIADPYSDASVAFATPAPTTAAATNDAASLLVISVPAGNTEVDLGAAFASGGDAGIRVKTDSHAHVVVGTPKTSISLGASPTEDLGAGITPPGLAFFTAGAITGTVCGDQKVVNINDVTGIVLGIQEEMVVGEDLDWHIGEHTDTHIGDHMDSHVGSHLDGHAGFHVDTHAGEHTDTHAGDHTDTHAGLHTDTQAGLHADTHVLVHEDTHAVAHLDDHIFDHEDMHCFLHDDIHLGDHTDEHYASHLSTGQTTLSDKVQEIDDTVTRITNGAALLKSYGTHMTKFDIWVWTASMTVGK